MNVNDIKSGVIKEPFCDTTRTFTKEIKMKAPDLHTTSEFMEKTPPNVVIEAISLEFGNSPFPVKTYSTKYKRQPQGEWSKYWLCLVLIEDGGEGVAVDCGHCGFEKYQRITIRYTEHSDDRGLGYEAEIADDTCYAAKERETGNILADEHRSPSKPVLVIITEKICRLAGIPSYIPFVPASECVRLPLPSWLKVLSDKKMYSKRLTPGDAHEAWQKFIAQDPFAPK